MTPLCINNPEPLLQINSFASKLIFGVIINNLAKIIVYASYQSTAVPDAAQTRVAHLGTAEEQREELLTCFSYTAGGLHLVHGWEALCMRLIDMVFKVQYGCWVLRKTLGWNKKGHM